MLAQVTLVIVPQGAILTVQRGERVLDEERWKFPRNVAKDEAEEVAKAIFDEAYDSMNWMVHSDDD